MEQDEEWDRLRNSRESPRRTRSIRDMDDFEEMPHFLTDDPEIGLPVDRDELFDRDVSRRDTLRSRREDRDFELIQNDFNDVNRETDWRGERRGESIREREWRELEERRTRGRSRLDRPDLRGVGRMPMRGNDWDDYRYPERRRPYDRDSTLYRNRETSRYMDDDRDYRRQFPRGDLSRRFYPDDPLYRRDEALGFDDYDDDYLRDGPTRFRSQWSPSTLREQDEDYRIRYGDRIGRRENDPYYENDRYYDDVPSARYFSREDEFRNRSYPAERRRDVPGSVGGPMPEELIGVDRKYASSRQKWTAGTSFDTVNPIN